MAHNPNGKGGGEMWVEQLLLMKKEGEKALKEIHAKARKAHEKEIPERFMDFLGYCVYAGADLVSRTLLAEENVLVRPPTAEELDKLRNRWEKQTQFTGQRTPGQIHRRVG